MNDVVNREQVVTVQLLGPENSNADKLDSKFSEARKNSEASILNP